MLNNSLKGIAEVYFERESHDVKNIVTTLTQFQIRFRELVGQEKLLLVVYGDVPTKFEKDLTSLIRVHYNTTDNSMILSPFRPK